MTDRRSQARLVPQDPCVVTLVFPTAALEGTAWNLSPNGAEILLSPESNKLDPQALGALLRAGRSLRLQFQEKERRASLVWFGRARAEQNEKRDCLAVGVEFREPMPLSGLMGPQSLKALRVSQVRHRSVGEFHVAKALRDLFLTVGEGDFSLESALALLCQKLRELTGAEGVDFWALEDGRAILRAQAGGSCRLGRVLSPEYEPVAQRFPTFKMRMQNGEQLFTNDLDHSPLADHPWVRRHEIQSAMIIPVFGRETDLGVLAFSHTKDPYAFGPRQQAEAEIFASQAALFFEKGKLLAEQAAQAIANARLCERVDQSKRIIRQQDRFRILGELAGVVSHEIKNALVPLRTLVKLLPERYDDADFRNWYAKTVPQEVDRMHGLVTQLSRFRGAENRVRESIDPTVLLRSVVDLVKPEAVSRQIRLELETEPELPAIEVVANEIRQVLLNLILNALQAVEEKGIVRVGVRRAQGGSGTLFWVSDTGPGIPSDKLEQIFDPLFTSKANGSGLGLAVARELVQSHGGNIHVESRVGSGATFYVLLPEITLLAESAGTGH